MNNEVFIFGGHADDLEWFRRYKCAALGGGGSCYRAGQWHVPVACASGMCQWPAVPLLTGECRGRWTGLTSFLPPLAPHHSHDTGKLTSDTMPSNRWVSQAAGRLAICPAANALRCCTRLPPFQHARSPCPPGCVLPCFQPPPCITAPCAVPHAVHAARGKGACRWRCDRERRCRLCGECILLHTLLRGPYRTRAGGLQGPQACRLCGECSRQGEAS